MTHDEIRSTWEECGSNEAFECFDSQGVDNAVIGDVLGQDVASEYSSWVYYNLK